MDFYHDNVWSMNPETLSGQNYTVLGTKEHNHMVLYFETWKYDSLLVAEEEG